MNTRNRERVLFGAGAVSAVAVFILVINVVLDGGSLSLYVLEAGFIAAFLRAGMLRPITHSAEKSVFIVRSAAFLALVPGFLIASLIELQEGRFGTDNIFRSSVWLVISIAGIYVVRSDDIWDDEKRRFAKIRAEFRSGENNGLWELGPGASNLDRPDDSP